jgi:uncharacterized coiled-coil DUF342 family protein
MELLDETGIDALTSLEDRIQKVVGLIPQMREQRDAAVHDKEEAVREAVAARAKLQELTTELETLRREREQVRARIEKLLGNMDSLNPG